ncbi:MAG TPA: DNA-binding protein [Nitrososphaerales archaeon]|nr:DNA-binding protein [Nitrososphaerales archaeon]
MEEDADIKLLERRKMEELRRKIKAAAPPPKAEKTDREVLQGVLFDRGDEVLDAALSQFPRETGRLVRELAQMVKSGRVTEPIGGGELLSIFRQLGLRVRMNTSIRVQDRGKLVDLSEKLSRKDE